jgi:hypothetical protein
MSTAEVFLIYPNVFIDETLDKWQTVAQQNF